MTPEEYGIEEFTNETLAALKKADARDELRDAIADMVKSIWLIGYNGGFEIAHEPAPCGHARGNWKDPVYGTPEYDGDERCEACAAVQVETARCAGIARDREKLCQNLNDEEIGRQIRAGDEQSVNRQAQFEAKFIAEAIEREDGQPNDKRQ